MSNTFHDTYVGHNNHAITANPDDGSYADIATRDADTTFQIDSNINKVIRVDNPLSFYILSSISPTVWLSLGTSVIFTLIGLPDTPGSYSGQAGNVIQVNMGETGVEFGQKLRTTDSPTFVEVTANSIIVGIAIPLNTTHRQIVTGNPHSVLASELSDYNSVWDARLGTRITDELSEGIINLYYTDSRVAANINVFANTFHRVSDGSSHTFIDQSVVVASSPTFVGLVLTDTLKVSSNTIIGSTSVNPDGALHVHVGSSGAVTANSVANALVVEDSKNTGISILTPAASSGRILFGSPADPFGAFLAWSDSVSDFAIGSSKIGANLRLTSDQETTNLTLSGGSGSELATFAKDVTITGQIKITGGSPGNSKVLRSDADGSAIWGDVGWTKIGTDVLLLNGNDSVGMGGIPDASAKLDVASTTKGFLPPRMTTAERDAIVSPAPGLEIYNTTVDKAEIFTGTTWKTILTEDLGQVVIQETFASTNVRFFGELALPAAQGWTDTATGSATIDLATETVFGEVRQVVRHNDDTGNGSTTSKITLTTQNWVDINAFGASYSGTARLDTVNGFNGFFSGLQVNAAENPLATGNRRYGILFDSDLGNLKLIEADNNPGNSVTMDGTGGNPLIPFDQFFRWECLVPAGLGAAQVFINGNLTTFVPLFLVNGGGLGTQIIVSSGSTGGANRVVFHDNFGVTIYEEAATKTLASSTMVANIAQVNIPEGKRDYTIILPDGNPRPIGLVLRLVANNLGGSVSLQNENPAVPEVLYNGLRTLVINVAVKETIEGINTVNSGNVYLGFQTIDFKTVGSIVVGGNTTATVISTINTFVDLNLGGNVSEEGNIERFTLTNTTTGEIRYDGNKPVSLILNGLIAAISAGGSQRFNFRLLKNGSPLPSPDNVDIPIEIGGNLDATIIHWPVRAVTGDLFRLQVENADGVSDITIDTLKFAMV